MRNAAIVVGAVLAVVLLLAVAVPPLIDWSRYKGEIAARVQAATGRPVAVNGPIRLSLLPSPQLSAADLVLGNPEGAPGELARIGHLRLDLRLLPLLAGKARIHAIELDRPVVTLTRLPDGHPNWRFTKAEPEATTSEGQPRRAARTEPPPVPEADDKLPFERLLVHDGRVSYGETLSVTELEAEVLLGGASGPFQAKGKASLGGVAVALEGVAERITPGRASPAALSLRLPGDDAKAEFSGLVTQLSGGQSLRGHLSAKAADLARTLARLNLARPVPPGALSVEGELLLSPEEASISNLDLAVGDQRLTGAVSAALAQVPQLDVRLAAGALDLDKWTAAPVQAQPAAAPVPAQPQLATAPAGTPTAAPVATPGGFSLPKGVFVTANLGVEALSWHGQVIRQAKFDGTLDQGELMIAAASALLPGASEFTADGTLSAEQGRPAFDGKARLASADAHALLAWAGVDAASMPADRLHSLELQAPVKLAWPNIRLDNFRLAVDGNRAQGNAVIAAGRPLGLALAATTDGATIELRGRIDGKRIDDGGFRLASPQGVKPLTAWGVKLPPALEKLGALAAEGSVAGTAEDLAVEFKGQSGTTSIVAKGKLAPKLVDLPSLTLRLGPNTLSGAVRADLAGAKPMVTADLAADSLALDSLLGTQRTGLLLPGGGMLLPPTAAPPQAPIVPAALVGAGDSPFSREPIDLSGLNAVDAKVTLRANTVTTKGWTLTNTVAQGTLQNGTASMERLTGKLLGGDLSLSGKLSANGAGALTYAIQGADLGAAKLAAGGMSVTSGKLDSDARLSFQGRSTHDMAAHLNGDGKLLVRNGVLDGFDLPAVNRQLGDLRNIGSLLGVVQAGLAGGRTPFSQLAGTFRADNGIVTSRDLKLDAEGGGATADATVDLPGWNTRTTIAFHLANAPQAPLTARLEGPLENPRKIVDVNAIQQFMVAQGLGRAFKSKEQPPSGDQQQSEQPREKNTGKNILKNLLKGLGGQ